MKKILFVFTVAAVALTACTNETSEYVGSGPEAKEIAFMPINQPATRTAVSSTTFPTASTMQVAAYMVEPTAGNFFSGTTFTYNYSGGSSGSSGKWGGNTAQYWPLSECYINFLAYANETGTGAFDSTTPASAATITQSDNSSAQTDLMYAIGQGQVTKSGNTLTIPESVAMQFKHAQAWICFTVQGSTNITLKSITLNGAKYSGTYTITHTAYNAKTGQSVSGAWSSVGETKNVEVPGWTSAALTGSAVTVGNGLLVVPDDTETGDFTKFTISYTLGGKDYTYEYTPSSTNVAQATKYTFAITMTANEIFVSPSVTDWTSTSATAVNINGSGS